MSTFRQDIEKDCIYHIYNRSVDKKIIFSNDDDYCWFLSKVAFYKEKYEIEIIAFALLPNHFHFVLKEPKLSNYKCVDSAITKFISCLCNSYAKHFNYLRNRKGNLFESRYQSKWVSDDYYLNVLIQYVNYNAVKHGLVDDVAKWDFSSYWDNLSPGRII